MHTRQNFTATIYEFSKFFLNVSQESYPGNEFKWEISGHSSSSLSWLGTALYGDSGWSLSSCLPDHWKPRNNNVIKARKAANSLYDVRIPTAPISNPPSIVPPPVPTPTNRPFRIPDKVKIRKVALLLILIRKPTELAGQFIQPVLINTLLVASRTYADRFASAKRHL